MTSNTFKSIRPDLKDTYSDSKPKKKRFGRLKTLTQSKGKATAEAKASANPMAALRDKSYLNLKGKKGIAV